MASINANNLRQELPRQAWYI